MGVLVPQLVVHGATAALQEVSGALGRSVGDVLRAHVPVIITHILPVFATGKKTPTASAAYDMLVKEISQEVSFTFTLLHGVWHNIQFKVNFSLAVKSCFLLMYSLPFKGFSIVSYFLMLMQGLEREIVNNLDEIVVSILSCLHDNLHSNTILR